MPLVIMTPSEHRRGLPRRAVEEIDSSPAYGLAACGCESEIENHEIRHHHSRRLRRRAARIAGRQAPLEAARVPNMDAIAAAGVVGRANNVPASLPAGSDVANLSLFGYDPLAYFTGRAPLEAAAQGIELGADDWAIRCNLVTVEDQTMRDFTAGHITTEEAKQLLVAAQEESGQ